MIIKSLSRKNGSYRSFQQLYDYITRDDGCDQKFNFTHNFIFTDRESILNEFTRNAQFVPKRKNGNYLYHEILSFTRSSQLSQTQQLEVIRKVSLKYLKQRAVGCLGFGGVHTDKDNQLHTHLIISANQLEQTKKHSLKKGAFELIKRNSEAYVLEQYPEMEQERLINQTNEEKKLKRSLKKKSERDIKRELFAEHAKEIMKQANSDLEFQELMKLHGVEVKYRPANITLTNPETGLPHRIKTLRLLEDYEQILERESKNRDNQKQPETDKTKHKQSKSNQSIDQDR